MRTLGGYLKKLRDNIKEQRGVFILFTLLRLMVIAALIRSLMLHHYEGAATCILVLVLFFLPSFLEDKLKLRIPALFEGIIYCFIFAAEILGELDHFYTQIPIWDTMLHTLNGFLFAAVGFSTVDLLNRTNKNFSLTPLYLTMVAFCFSMTIGVLWEFFECGADLFLGQDMQKDFIIGNFQSVTLDPTHSQQVIAVEDVTSTLIQTGSGDSFLVEGGYLDIGILDTMKDLFVNFIGALVFCSFGFAYLKYGESKKIASTVVSGLRLQPAEEEATEEATEEVKEEITEETTAETAAATEAETKQ